MNFASDNTGPTHPKIMAALQSANQGYAMPYGKDPLTQDAVAKLRGALDAPEAAVYFTAVGTATNALILATLAHPWQCIFCHTHAHIHEDECNAPEFYAGGAKLMTVAGQNGKMTPNALRQAIEAEETRGIHGAQRGPVSLTQATEKGTVYDLAEIRALADVAHEYGLPVHMDGARLSNACATLGCTLAQMTWQAGVDALSFGGTKNGLIAAEAAVFFNPKHGLEFEYRRKRGGHLFSKHRYLSAQMLAFLQDDLWLEMAQTANAACARLHKGLQKIEQVDLEFTPQANVIFARFARAHHQRLHAAGAQYYVMDGDISKGPADEKLLARLVTDWSASKASVDQFLQILGKA